MNRYSRIALLCLACLLAITSLRPTLAATPDPLPGLETFIDAFMTERLEQHGIPNATVAIVADGAVQLAKGYGLADRAAGTPVSPEDTLFRLGSTSKLFTWTAIMQLAEQGRLDLNADINDYLDFAIPTQLHDGTAAEPITLKHLLTHTPGFEDSVNNLFRLDPEHMPPLGDYVKAHMPARIFPAGTVAAYSNYGTALAGYMVERVSGQPFTQYVAEHIFAPLGMSQSSFAQPLPPALAANLARPYRLVNGSFHDGAFEYMPAPAGGMSSSATDMAKFMLAHLQGGSHDGGRILQPETVSRMHSQLYTQHPELGGMAYGFMEGTFNGHRVIFQSGSTTLYDTGFYLLPNLGVGLFISYSGDSFVTHTDFVHAGMNEYYPQGHAANPPAAPPPGAAERAHALVGEYHQNRRNVTTSEAFLSLTTGIINVRADADGYLFVTHAGQTNRFVESEPGVYSNTGPGLDYFGPFQTIAFGTDPSGQSMLMSDGPMTYSRAPWYGTQSFTIPTLLLAVAFIAITTLVWFVRGIVRLFRRPAQTRLTKLSTATAFIFGLLTVNAIAAVLGNGRPDPVHALPVSALLPPSNADALLAIVPWLMLPLGLACAVLAVVHWRRPVWSFAARIHYTLFALAILALLGTFHYWNLLG